MIHPVPTNRLLERWGKGLCFLAAAWFLLLLFAWLRRNADHADVLLFGVLPAAFYWTVGQVLLRWRQRNK